MRLSLSLWGAFGSAAPDLIKVSAYFLERAIWLVHYVMKINF